MGGRSKGHAGSPCSPAVMTIVDTTVWADYFRGERTPEAVWLDDNLLHERLALTELILREVLQGAADDRWFQAVRRELLTCEVFSTGGMMLAIASAVNDRRIRAQGRTVRRTIDCLIAPFCLQHDYALLHKDREFDPFEELLGLTVIHP